MRSSITRDARESECQNLVASGRPEVCFNSGLNLMHARAHIPCTAMTGRIEGRRSAVGGQNGCARLIYRCFNVTA
jgi:hypothetical protein